MASVTHFLESHLRLKVNRAKSTVGRPWNRTFLGYTRTTERSARPKPTPSSVERAKGRIRQITHQGRGRNIRRVIAEVTQYTRGWVEYFRLSSVKHAFDVLDQRYPPTARGQLRTCTRGSPTGCGRNGDF